MADLNFPLNPQVNDSYTFNNRTFRYDGSKWRYVNLTLVTVTSGTAVTSINSLSNSAQDFAVGTTGSGFNISSTSSTHTFNIPIAGSGSTGLITGIGQTIAGPKTFSSDLLVSSSTASTNSTSGALIVTGGVGVAESLSVGNYILLDNGYGSVTTTPFASIFAKAIGSNATSLMQVKGNDGTVGMGMKALTGGNSLIYSNNALEFRIGSTIRDLDIPTGGTTYMSLGTTGVLALSSSTASTSTTTGALTVSGGAGIAKSLSIGGRLQLFNSANYTAFVSSASGNTVYTLPATSPATGTSVLQSTSAGILSWVPMVASGGAGSGTVYDGSLNSIPYYFAAGTAVTGSSNFTNTGTSINVGYTTAATNSSSGALTVVGGVGIGGSLYVAGDLTINGTTTTINTVTLTVDDKNIELGSVTSPNDTTAEGGGITLRGATDKSINWYTGTGWSSSENWNLVSGSTYKINNTTVLSNSSLGTGVTNSSLTALGTITTGVWSGTSITAYYGGTGLQTSFTVGDLLYANTASTWNRLSPGTNGFILVSAGTANTPTYTNPATLTIGTATTATNVNVVNATTNSAHPLHFSPLATGSGIAVSSNTTLSYNPSSFILSTSGLAITATTPSTSSSTGALIVTGGVGIGDSLFVAGNISFNTGTNGLLFRKLVSGNYGAIYSTNVTPSATNYTMITDGASVNFNGTSGVYFNISNTNKIQVTSTNINIVPVTESTSASTGALTIAGGVGIGGSLYVASASGISGVTINAGVVTGSLTGTATTATNVNVVAATTSANHPLLFTPTSGSASGVAVSSKSTLVYNPSTDILSISGISVTSSTASTTTTTGSLIVTGGVGIGQSISVGGRLQLFNSANYTAFVSSATGNTVYTLPTTSPATGSSVLQSTSAGVLSWVAMSSGSATPAGTTDGVVQFKSGSSLGGTISLFFNPLTLGLRVSGFPGGEIPTSTDAALKLEATVGSFNGSVNGTYYAANAPTGFAGDLMNLQINAVSKFKIDNTGAIIQNIGTNSTSTTSGAVQIKGGVGITGAVFVGESINATSTTTSTSTSTGSLIVSGGAGIAGTINLGGTQKIFSSTASTNTWTGALTVGGGVGISGQLTFAQASFGYTGITINPSMSFIGNTSSSPITLTVLTDNSLNWEGSQGSVFSIDSNLSTGEIFSVSDISGLPIISASAGQTVTFNEFGGYTQFGNGLINSSSTTTGSLVVSGGLGVTGNVAIGGTFIRSSWTVGEVIATRVYNNTDLGMSATTTISSTTYTNIALITYTPKSTTSHLWIEFDANYDYSNGSTTDDFFSRITVAGSAIVEKNQIFLNVLGGSTRSGVIFPISGRYTNSTTSGIAISVQAKWGTSDDNIRVYGNSTSGYMRIQEIGR